jgi:hypothetical protein
MSCELVQYSVDKDIMPLYLDTAKTYMNLSSGALALTMVFREKVIGAKPGTTVAVPLVVCWSLFLVAIGASAFYQYLAVKFLDSISCSPGAIQYFHYLVQHPGKVYGVMQITFFLGACFLVVACVAEMWPKRH